MALSKKDAIVPFIYFRLGFAVIAGVGGAISYLNKAGDTMGGNLNMSDYNITDVDTLFVHNISGRSPINIIGNLLINGVPIEEMVSNGTTLGEELDPHYYNNPNNYLSSFYELDPAYSAGIANYYTKSEADSRPSKVNLTTTSCPLNQVMNGINNATGTVSCVNDQTGSSSGWNFYNYNSTIAVQTMTSSAVYVNMTNLTLNLPSSGNVNIECKLLVDAAAATTGVHIMARLTGGNASQRTEIETFTSATAKAVCAGTYTPFNCSVISSAGTTTVPVDINVYSKRSGAGTFDILMKSEIATSASNIREGSWCRSVLI